MERKLGTFGLADFYIGQKRVRPNFLDAVSVLITWGRIENLLKKKLRRMDENLLASRLIRRWQQF
jgi:hypothetical protein